MAVVGYSLDDQTVVRFEVEPGDDFQPAGAGEVVARIKEAVEPAVAGARGVLGKGGGCGAGEGGREVGIKGSGAADWLTERAATEANFGVTLTWKAPEASAVAEGPGAGSATSG